MASTTRASSLDRGAHHHGVRANAHNNRDRLLFEAADDRSIFVARGIPESSAGSVRPRWIGPGEVRLYESKMRERNFVASSFSVSLIRVNLGPVVVHARRCKTWAFLFAEPPLQNSSLMITSACLVLKPRASTLSEKDRKIFSTVKLTLVRIALVWLGSLAMAPLVIAATPTPTGTSAVVPAVIEGRWVQPAEPNTPHARFPLSQLIRTPKGHAVIVATSDEMDPAAAEYAPETREFWRYKGSVAKQSWRCEEPDPALQVLVNGRYVYWNSQSAIPGGVSFENFEMLSPFRQAEEFIFAVEPMVSPNG